ncbi:hypothetical protein DW892_05060 [Collinsella sp. AM40-7AC]|uniref:hypothetical protein n=1 Tax=Collinsella TaxID=102106 RepID=UPI000E505607|nr:MULTISPECIES: hypothetical protein [Collinsella]RHB19131.1 hypothetical protein DW892_05060 [Collinsella sp. AM40-7AC]
MAVAKDKKPKKPEIKYQATIHKKYAEFIDKEAKAEANKALEVLKKTHPNVQLAFKPSPLAEVLTKTNLDICKALFVDSEESGAFSFNKPRSKTVEQTVRANLIAYNNAKTALEEEAFDDYKYVYITIVDALEVYFSIAAESALREYFTGYAEFADNYTKEEEKKQAEKSVKRRKTEEEKKQGKDAEK